MFSNEASGYSRLWNNSLKTGNEEMGIITNNGVLVLPNYKNDRSSVPFRGYGYNFQNGNMVDASGKIYNTLGTIHTHPSGNQPSTWVVGYDAGYGDLGFAAQATPNKPVFVMQMQQTSDLSFIISQKANNQDIANGFNRFNTVNVTSGLPSINSKSIQTKGGLIWLIKTQNLRQYTTK
jgi:hypothetical protein